MIRTTTQWSGAAGQGSVRFDGMADEHVSQRCSLGIREVDHTRRALRFDEPVLQPAGRLEASAQVSADLDHPCEESFVCGQDPQYVSGSRGLRKALEMGSRKLSALFQ
jgi:hypothetical protein